MRHQFADKIVLVTGASSGIGMATAREIGRRGGIVVLVARRQNLLEDLATQIVQEDGRAFSFPCDVVQPENVRSLIDQVRERFGQIHLLVNAAGREHVMPLQIMKPEASRDLFDINVIALAEVTRACLGLLKPGSAVVNISSVAGLAGSPGLSIYGATKAAVISLTRSCAKELASRKIRVNAVAPGMVRSKMSERIFSKMQPEQVAALEADHPLGFGTPEQVASAVAFLGSDEAAWITGHTLVIDGGYSA